MNKRDYQNFMREYIDSLEASDTIATVDQWRAWIREEATEKSEEMTDEEIGWIIEVLENEGYVVGEKESLSIEDFSSGRHNTASLISIGFDDFTSKYQDVDGADWQYAFTTSSATELASKINELAHPEDYTIEFYSADSDGDFVDGSDFDAPKNFMERLSEAERTKK